MNDIILGGGGGSCLWNVYCLRETWSSEESFGMSGQAEPSGVEPDQAKPSHLFVFPFLFRLVWFWMGCRSCPKTRPVETCAGIARSGLKGDRPLWNTHRSKGQGWSRRIQEAFVMWRIWREYFKCMNMQVYLHVYNGVMEHREHKLHFLGSR